jgi:hypothetical protein
MADPLIACNAYGVSAGRFRGWNRQGGGTRSNIAIAANNVPLGDRSERSVLN